MAYKNISAYTYRDIKGLAASLSRNPEFCRSIQTVRISSDLYQPIAGKYLSRLNTFLQHISPHVRQFQVENACAPFYYCIISYSYPQCVLLHAPYYYFIQTSVSRDHRKLRVNPNYTPTDPPTENWPSLIHAEVDFHVDPRINLFPIGFPSTARTVMFIFPRFSDEAVLFLSKYRIPDTIDVLAVTTIQWSPFNPTAYTFSDKVVLVCEDFDTHIENFDIELTTNLTVRRRNGMDNDELWAAIRDLVFGRTESMWMDCDYFHDTSHITMSLV
jgi:hypothetical protein